MKKRGVFGRLVLKSLSLGKIVLAGLVPLLLSACAHLQSAQTPVVRHYHHAVVLESSADAVFNHPQDLDVAVLKGLLARLNYVGTSGLVSEPTTMAVFQPAEIERLAPALQQALHDASAKQWVRFVSFGQKQGVLFNSSRKTEGVLFFSPDNQVNIAFSFINAKRAPSETSAIYHQFATLNPLEIDASETPLVVEESGVHLKHSANGRRASMWLEADLQTFADYLMDKELSVPESSVEPTIVFPLKRGDALVKEEVTAPFTAEQQRQQQIIQKLRFFKRLFDEGLISLREYEEQKANVLMTNN
nr:hypothetical protein [uncultured Desulfuromonas sp.]